MLVGAAVTVGVAAWSGRKGTATEVTVVHPQATRETRDIPPVVVPDPRFSKQLRLFDNGPLPDGCTVTVIGIAPPHDNAAGSVNALETPMGEVQPGTYAAREYDYFSLFGVEDGLFMLDDPEGWVNQIYTVVNSGCGG